MKPGSGRVQPLRRARVASGVVLAVVGSAAALTFLFGDRTSRLLAFVALLAGAVLACLLAWRDNRMAERRRRARSLNEAMQHAELLHAERVRQQAVVTVLAGRIRSLSARLAAANRRASTLQQELSTLRGNFEVLRVELELQSAVAADAARTGLAQRDDPVRPQVITAWQDSPHPTVFSRSA